MSRLARLSLAGALVAATFVASPAVAAKADRPDNGRKKAPSAVKIVQMGDSYSSGNGAGSYLERDCWRSEHSYGAQVAAQIGAEYDNVACSGAVLKDLLEARALAGPRPQTATYTIDPVAHPDQRAEWLRIARAEQLCGVPAEPDLYFIYDVTSFVAVGDQATATSTCQMMTEPQINAVNPSTDMVFVTIGGNDIGFSTIVVNCLVARIAFTCKNTMDAARAKIDQMKEETKAAALAVHKRTKGKAEIYLLGYPFLINTDDYSISEAAPTYNVGATLHELQVHGDHVQAAGIVELNAATRSSDFHFVDVKPEWGQHAHGLDPRAGADQSQSWIVPPFAANYVLPEWAHPTLDGWNATARALHAAVTG